VGLWHRLPHCWSTWVEAGGANAPNEFFPSAAPTITAAVTPCEWPMALVMDVSNASRPPIASAIVM
jgi:hypothetical protein